MAADPILKKKFDLEITIISAESLKNTNWLNGNLRACATVWVHPLRHLTTKTDESNSINPIWNEHFLTPLPSTPSAAILHLNISHGSEPCYYRPSGLVGLLHIKLRHLPEPENSDLIRTFGVRLPCGRVKGEIRLKIAVVERGVSSPPWSPSVIPYDISKQREFVMYQDDQEDFEDPSGFDSPIRYIIHDWTRIYKIDPPPGRPPLPPEPLEHPPPDLGSVKETVNRSKNRCTRGHLFGCHSLLESFKKFRFVSKTRPFLQEETTLKN